MSVYGGPEVSNDGLVVSLDAGNTKSYSGSGTAWNDLSGNGYNFTLFNTPTFSSENGGYLYFVTNRYATTSYQQPAQDNTTSFTWSTWVCPIGAITLPPIIGNRGSTELVFTKLSSTQFEYYPGAIVDNMPIGTWQHITIVKSATSFSYYRNGVLSSSATLTGTKAAVNFYIGGDPTTPEYSNARVATLNIYHRALAQEEIRNNFNALRGRYNV